MIRPDCWRFIPSASTSVVTRMSYLSSERDGGASVDSGAKPNTASVRVIPSDESVPRTTAMRSVACEPPVRLVRGPQLLRSDHLRAGRRLETGRVGWVSRCRKACERPTWGRPPDPRGRSCGRSASCWGYVDMGAAAGAAGNRGLGFSQVPREIHPPGSSSPPGVDRLPLALWRER